MKTLCDRRRWRVALSCFLVLALAALSGLCHGVGEGEPPTSTSAIPGDASFAAVPAQEKPYHLYVIVSDMKGSTGTLLGDSRPFYEMLLMSLAADLSDSGRLDGVSFCTVQTQSRGYTALEGGAGQLAGALYASMEQAVPSGESISENTWQAVERAMDQSLEADTRPVLMLLFGSDVSKLSRGPDLSEKTARSGALIYYFKSDKAFEDAALRDSFGIELQSLPRALTGEPEKPAGAGAFVVNCGDGAINSGTNEWLKEIVTQVSGTLLGKGTVSAPLAYYPLGNSYAELIPGMEGQAQSTLRLTNTDPSVETLMLWLSGTDGVLPLREEAVVAMGGGSHAMVILSGNTAVAGAAYSPEISADTQLPGDNEVSASEVTDAQQTAVSNGVAAVIGAQAKLEGVLVRVDENVRRQQLAQKVLEALTGGATSWQAGEDGGCALTADFTAVADEAWAALADGRCGATLDVLRGDELVKSVPLSGDPAGRALTVDLSGAGVYRAEIAVAMDDSAASAPLDEPFTVDNRKPELAKRAEIDLGSFVDLGDGETLATLELSGYFTDADRMDTLTFTVNGEPLEGSTWTLLSGGGTGDVQYAVTASDGAEESESLTIRARLLSLRDLLSSESCSASVTPEECFKGSECSVNVALSIQELETLKNGGAVRALLDGAALSAQLTELGDVALATIPRAEGEDVWRWEGHFTLPTDVSRTYALTIVSNTVPLGEKTVKLEARNVPPAVKTPVLDVLTLELGGLERSGELTLRLSDFFETEPFDLLHVAISSEGAAFALDPDGHGLIQQKGKGGDCGEILWDVTKDPDYPMTLRLNQLSAFGNNAGTLKIVVTDQEGASCETALSFRTKNGLIGLLTILGLALLAIIVVLAAFLLLRRRKVGSIRGLVYRVTLEDDLGRVWGEADTRAWNGNRLSVDQLLYLAQLPPQRVVKREVLERIVVFAEVEGGRRGSFGVAAQEADMGRIHAEIGRAGKGGFTGCKRIFIAGDREGERIIIDTSPEGKTDGSR